MQPRSNYTYYNNNSYKDMNQSGQGGSNKQGKNIKYNNNKYFKGDPNRNNQNNMEEKVNMNQGDYNQNYNHYRPRQNRKNGQEINNNQNPPFKKKKKKMRDNNNDFQYQNNNNTSEISQSSKEEYMEQQQNNSNINNNANNNYNHQNMYKQNKKNQMLYNNNNINNNINNINNNMNINNNLGNINPNINNTNSNNNSNMNNISNPNLTPQRHNQMTNPFGFGQNLSNNKNINSPNFNLNNLNQGGKSPINAMLSQQTNQSQQPQQNQIYINPNFLLMGVKKSLSMNENDQDMNLKDEKSSENLSEETLSTRGGNQQGDGNNLQMNKNNNEFLNQELLMNNRFLQQSPNYIAMPYNMNNINNINSINNPLGNINNMNNISNSYNNNINNMQNISNYNQNLVNQINNLGNLNNISMSNFQMPIYDQQNNQIFNAVMNQNIKPNYSIPINEEMNKIGNKSPNEQYSINPGLNIGNVLPNLNYKGPILNNNLNANNIKNKKVSLSSQGPKNTMPNFNQADNLNFTFNQNKINQQGISPLLNMSMNALGNKNFYIPQNMKNPHMNNMWNNLNNNNHMVGPNNNINNPNLNDNFNANKKKDYNRANHNNNSNNNKKYQKVYNHSTYQPKNLNNNHVNNKNNKSNQNIDNNSNPNLNNSNNSNNNLPKKNNINNNMAQNNILRSNKSSKPYLLSLCIALENNQKEIINIKSIKDVNLLLQQIKEKRNLSEKMIKLIQKKINITMEIMNNIFDYNLNRYTYKNLVDINHQIINHKERKAQEIDSIKNKNNSSKQLNKIFDDEFKLNMKDVKKGESLNISY